MLSEGFIIIKGQRIDRIKVAHWEFQEDPEKNIYRDSGYVIYDKVDENGNLIEDCVLYFKDADVDEL